MEFDEVLVTPLFSSEFLIYGGVTHVVFVKGCDAAGIPTINMDTSQSEN